MSALGSRLLQFVSGMTTVFAGGALIPQSPGLSTCQDENRQTKQRLLTYAPPIQRELYHFKARRDDEASVSGVSREAHDVAPQIVRAPRLWALDIAIPRIMLTAQELQPHKQLHALCGGLIVCAGHSLKMPGTRGAQCAYA